MIITIITCLFFVKMSGTYGLKPLVGSLGSVRKAQDLGDGTASTQRAECEGRDDLVEGWLSIMARKQKELPGCIFLQWVLFWVDVHS